MIDTELNERQLGQYIPLHYHYQMLQDESRMLGFRDAIRRTVPDGGRVLELGGGTGALSFYAARNASKVWCVERQPALARKAGELLARNAPDADIQVVHADAFSYLPPEPVDVVICEMLHSALLREKQVAMLASFRERYSARFGPPLPRFIPEATILGFDLLCHDYDFFGYSAPVPVFQGPGNSERVSLLSAPALYAIVQYSEPLQNMYGFDGDAVIATDGILNAVRFITTNALAVLEEENRSINWMNQNLILPLPAPVPVREGDLARVRFSYNAGGEIDELQSSLAVSVPGRRQDG